MAAVTANGSNGTANGPAPGRLASVYSEVQTSRLLHALPFPSVLRSNFTVADGPASSAAGSPGERTRLRRPPPPVRVSRWLELRFVGFGADEIAKLFPCVFGQPSVSLVPSAEPAASRPLKVGVVLSGGQAPGGHNVICGIFGECCKLHFPSCSCKLWFH
jgi:diphosphate-dependent phosphofructokinase